MNTFNANRSLIAVVFPVVLAVGCGPKPPIEAAKPDAISFSPDATVQWLVGAPATLSITSTVLASGQPVVFIPGKCANLKIEDVNTNLLGELTTIGNLLSEKDSPKPYTSKWVSPSANIHDFRVSLISNQTVQDVAAGFSYASSLKVGANESYESNKFLLTIGSIARKVSLTPDAATCVKANVCVATANKPGPAASAVSAVYYGSLIRLNITSGTVTAGADVSVAEYAKLTFDFSNKHMDIQGGLIGALTQPEDIKQKYDVDMILKDLQAHKLITVSDKINKMATAYGVVAVDTMAVSDKDCKLISGK